MRGRQDIDEASQSDPVLVGANASYLYTFTSVVDDIAFAISHVIRGADHVTNTGAEISSTGRSRRAAGIRAPAPADRCDGRRPLKRIGSLSLADLRDEGIEPLAPQATLATVGARAPELTTSLAALAADFDLARFGGGSPRFDPAEVSPLNARLLRESSFAEVSDRCRREPARNSGRRCAAILQRLGDVEIRRRICEEPVAPVIDCPESAAGAALLLPEEPWDEGTWGRWTAAVKQVTGHSGRGLFHPLRLALTARGDGPELASFCYRSWAVPGRSPGCRAQPLRPRRLGHGQRDAELLSGDLRRVFPLRHPFVLGAAMSIQLYNTLTRRKELFQPIDAADVRVYVCGPTVYDYAHIGNARPVVVFDLLYRLLRRAYGAGHVTYVRNITDVEDKIIAAAAERGEAIAELTQRTTAHLSRRYGGAERARRPITSRAPPPSSARW